MAISHNDLDFRKNFLEKRDDRAKSTALFRSVSQRLQSGNAFSQPVLFGPG
jgi:hypothetical protein